MKIGQAKRRLVVASLPLATDQNSVATGRWRGSETGGMGVDGAAEGKREGRETGGAWVWTELWKEEGEARREAHGCGRGGGGKIEGSETVQGGRCAGVGKEEGGERDGVRGRRWMEGKGRETGGAWAWTGLGKEGETVHAPDSQVMAGTAGLLHARTAMLEI